MCFIPSKGGYYLYSPGSDAFYHRGVTSLLPNVILPAPVYLPEQKRKTNKQNKTKTIDSEQCKHRYGTDDRVAITLQVNFFTVTSIKL